MMRILADRNNPYVAEAFCEFGSVEALSTAEFTRSAVGAADALIIRSETRITRDLLEDSRVRFVGTVSAGYDHVDAEFLAQQNIRFASAAGCNANAVAEYVIAALMRHAAGSGIALRGMTIGVVGVGNIGGRVAAKAEQLGMRVLQNDPPLQRKGQRGPFVTLEDIVKADVVSLHVPLTRTGLDPTHHLIGARWLDAMKPGAVLINTARGGVVSEDPLKEALVSGHLSAAILDVWENEPAIDVELLTLAELGTSHIAGYSFDGKLNGVKMIHRALAEFLGVRPRWSGPEQLPEPNHLQCDAERLSGQTVEEATWEVIRKCGRLEEDDAALRRIAELDAAQRPAEFRRLRAEYPARREFGATVVRIKPGDPEFANALRVAGFRLA